MNHAHRGRSACARIAALMLAACLYAICTAPLAWADAGVFGETTTETQHDTAGNVVMAGNDVTVFQDVERDALLAGNQVEVSAVPVGGDVLAAGQAVQVKKSDVAGNLRLAGSTIVVEGTQVGGNATVAGNAVQLSEGVSAASVYAYGNYVTFKGSSRYAAIAAQNVQFDGQVEGDVTITANSVTVGPNAQVTGKLTVVGAQPDVADGAEIGALDVQLAEGRSGASVVLASLRSAVLLLLAMLATMGVMYWVAPTRPQDALFMLQARTAPMLVTGLMALIAVPFAVIVLLATGVGSLLAVVLVCLTVALAVLGLPFMCMVFAKRVMSRSQEWVVVCLAAAFAGLLLSVPALNVAAVLCGGVFIAGYVLQLAFLKLKARSATPQPQMQAQPPQTPLNR